MGYIVDAFKVTAVFGVLNIIFKMNLTIKILSCIITIDLSYLGNHCVAGVARFISGAI